MTRLLLAVALLLLSAQVCSQTYPNRRVTIVVGVAAGSSLFIITQLVADKMRERFKVPFIVEARPGAGGMLSFDAAKNFAPDGYNLVVTNNSLVAAKFTNKNCLVSRSTARRASRALHRPA